MKIKKENKINDNGSFTEIVTIETTPKDGLIPESSMHKADFKNRRKFHIGYSKSTMFTTNDPRKTRPFIYFLSGLFLIIGIGSIITHSWFFGITFTSVAIIMFIVGNKEIDEVEKELKESKNNKDKQQNNWYPKKTSNNLAFYKN